MTTTKIPSWVLHIETFLSTNTVTAFLIMISRMTNDNLSEFTSDKMTRNSYSEQISWIVFGARGLLSADKAPYMFNFCLINHSWTVPMRSHKLSIYSCGKSKYLKQS